LEVFGSVNALPEFVARPDITRHTGVPQLKAHLARDASSPLLCLSPDQRTSSERFGPTTAPRRSASVTAGRTPRSTAASPRAARLSGAASVPS